MISPNNRRVLAVIPSRYGSTRFPGKPLALILGKPLLQHVWEAVAQTPLITKTIIATDDERIKKVAENFGASVVLTGEAASGTDRVVHVVQRFPDYDVVLNIQGDEPLINSARLKELCDALAQHSDAAVATLRTRLRTLEDYLNPNVVKVVVDKNDYALYFSRSPVPYLKRREEFENHCFWQHVGVYAFRSSFLSQWPDLASGLLTRAEDLEQLRILEAGFKIVVPETPHVLRGVDTPEDVSVIEKLLKTKGI